VAWHPLGWKAAWYSEIEPFPSAVLKHHYPTVPNYGDMTKYEAWPNEPINLLVGGTPCQSFSVAGLRKGLADPRGNLMLTYGAIAKRYSPKWLVWENVPGVLSSNGGRDFGTFLGMLAELGYGFAYRVLDAQYFGVAQRRRRVFVVGCLGDAGSAAAVLFERNCLQGNIEERGKKSVQKGEIAGTLTTRTGVANDNYSVEQGHLICDKYGPRWIMPIECERLQGFSDNFTKIPWRNKSAEECPDTPRYKALGNSMAVPVMRWIGERIKKVEEL